MRAGDKAEQSARQQELDEAEARRRRAERARALAQRKADSMPVVAAPEAPRQERVVDAPLVDPSPSGGLREVFSKRYLLRLIVSRELAKMYAASVLGLFWSYIQPAMRFTVYYFIFGFVLRFHKDIPNFALHLFCGMVFVHLFSEMWSGGTRSIWGNKGLVLKMRVPREIFPVASFIVAIYHTLPQLLLLAVICLLLGWHVTWAAVGAGLLGLAIVLVFGAALGLMFAAFNVFFRDTANLVGTISMFLPFMVPQLYGYNLVHAMGRDHPVLYEVYMANPLANAVILLQKLFWQPVADTPAELAEHFPPELWTRGFIVLGCCLVLLFVAQRFFARLEGKFPERL